LVAVGGPIIESAAARACGNAVDGADAERLPSAMALCLFAPVGRAIAEALAVAWQEDQGCVVTIGAASDVVEAAQRTMHEADVMVAVTMTLSGSTRGRIRLLARPATLLAPPAPIEAVPAAPGAIDAALAEVPIEVRVQLGRILLTMRQIEELTVGTVIPFLQFVDDAVPVNCAGMVKAYGKPVVHRGMLAVEIQAPDAAKGVLAA
jgi:flagellar motor switch protein FliM